MRRTLVLVAAVTFLLVACSKSEKQKTNDSKIKACSTFEGGKLSATWNDCPDKVRREVKCKPFIDQLNCECFEDGVEKTFFFANDPPLSTREDATRIVNKHCRWALEMP